MPSSEYGTPTTIFTIELAPIYPPCKIPEAVAAEPAYRQETKSPEVFTTGQYGVIKQYETMEYGVSTFDMSHETEPITATYTKETV